MSVTDLYSGIAIDQNALATGSIAWRAAPFSSQTVYQTFYLSSTYERGTTAVELRYPDLSGFQVMVTVDAGCATCATLTYTMDYYVPGSGWTNLINGIAIGAPTDGLGWYDVIFPQSIPINVTTASALLRVGVTTQSTVADVVNEPAINLGNDSYLIETVQINAVLQDGVPYPVMLNGRAGFLLSDQGTTTFSAQQGVGALWYTSPSPLSTGAFLSNATTPLLGPGTSAALNFRILALSADGGTDFLGNEYRSCVIQASGADASTYWMSTAQPSSFSVVSRYFDVRPDPSTPTFGDINLVTNPSFEYDPEGSVLPFAWSVYDHLVTRNNFQVQNTWAASGVQSLRSTSTFATSVLSPYSGVITPGLGASGLIIQSAAPYSVECEVNILSLPTGGSLLLSLFWYNAAGTLISVTSSSTATLPGVQTLSLTAMAPPTALDVALAVYCTSNPSGTLDFYLDAVQLTPTLTVGPYFDGDTPGGFVWLAQRGRSGSATLVPSLTDSPVVIDGVLVDPAIPNMAFNVYYSTDDSGDSTSMNETDWEQKLWTRVPQVYVATQRQEYVFPEPITASYVKLEFTNLPAQTFNPGLFTQPVAYKKFPTWVADYFIVQLELPSFVANLVNVQNDALTFAYDYYLDDLDQTPAAPVAAPANVLSTLTDYFNLSNASNMVDADTLAQINLVISSFQLPTGSLVDPDTLLGSATQTIVNGASSVAVLTSETPIASAPNYSIVSTLQREPVVFEQSMPVMFFFIPCRHTYKELTTTFDYNKAYFAGTNNVVFLRANYATATDTPLYIESGNDNVNAVINDFVTGADGNWYCP